MRVVIVGAGIGGLTAALSLLRRGIEVEVHEAAPALGEIGFHNDALSTPDQAQRYVDREWEAGRIADRYDWLYDYDATTAAINSLTPVGAAA